MFRLTFTTERVKAWAEAILGSCYDWMTNGFSSKNDLMCQNVYAQPAFVQINRNSPTGYFNFALFFCLGHPVHVVASRLLNRHNVVRWFGRSVRLVLMVICHLLFYPSNGVHWLGHILLYLNNKIIYLCVHTHIYMDWAVVFGHANVRFQMVWSLSLWAIVFRWQLLH